MDTDVLGIPTAIESVPVVGGLGERVRGSRKVCDCERRVSVEVFRL